MSWGGGGSRADGRTGGRGACGEGERAVGDPDKHSYGSRAVVKGRPINTQPPRAVRAVTPGRARNPLATPRRTVDGQNCSLRPSATLYMYNIH